MLSNNLSCSKYEQIITPVLPCEEEGGREVGREGGRDIVQERGWVEGDV